MDNQNKTREELQIELQVIKKEHNDLKKSYEIILEEVKLDEDMILKLLKAVNTTSDAIFITDTEGIITYINSGFTALYGFTFDEVVGKLTPRILKCGLLEKKVYENFWKTLLNKIEVKGELLNKRKNGELVYVEGTASTILNEQNEIIGFLGIQRDNTERKKNEEKEKQLAELTMANRALVIQNEEKEKWAAELIKAKEKAEESDRLKSAFLANMSHEIRTPMNGILGFAELLKEHKLSGEKQLEYLSIIEKSGARMLNIINDIVSISKIESGIMETYISETNINEQTEYVYKLLKHDAEKKKLNIIIKNGLPEKKSIIKTDNEKFIIILSNLVKNAIKYTDQGSVEFGYILKTNTTAGALDAQELEFYIKDTGIGIPKDRQEAIFERFIQADIGDRMARQGAGLGLAITKAHIAALGGRIWVESEEGKGSTFFFTIPYNVEPKQEIIIENDVSADTEITDKNLKILIAEDDEVSEMLISISVEMFSKEILRVCTGADAVETCRNNNNIDLILMDVQMNNLNGYEATRQIRQFNKDVVIIAQTAFGLSGNREKAIEAGCNDYISKPINNAVLMALIQKYFKK